MDLLSGLLDSLYKYSITRGVWKYLGQFDTNHIIFRNVEIPTQNKKSIFFLNENKESDEIFRNISFLKMELSK
jgi:hypothetical protein